MFFIIKYELMRKLILIIAGAGLFLAGCQNKSSVADGLDDDHTRASIYAAILKDHKYLSEFLDSLRTNHHARMMMHSDTAMMRHMVGGMPLEMVWRQMLIKAKDSAACKTLCSVMMDHKSAMHDGSMKCMKKGSGEKSDKIQPAKHH